MSNQVTSPANGHCAGSRPPPHDAPDFETPRSSAPLDRATAYDYTTAWLFDEAGVDVDSVEIRLAWSCRAS